LCPCRIASVAGPAQGDVHAPAGKSLDDVAKADCFACLLDLVPGLFQLASQAVDDGYGWRVKAHRLSHGLEICQYSVYVMRMEGMRYLERFELCRPRS
jgi:hypothetical protein